MGVLSGEQIIQGFTGSAAVAHFIFGASFALLAALALALAYFGPVKPDPSRNTDLPSG